MFGAPTSLNDENLSSALLTQTKPGRWAVEPRTGDSWFCDRPGESEDWNVSGRRSVSDSFAVERQWRSWIADHYEVVL
jgi:hypothetical protein